MDDSDGPPYVHQLTKLMFAFEGSVPKGLPTNTGQLDMCVNSVRHWTDFAILTDFGKYIEDEGGWKRKYYDSVRGVMVHR